MDATLGNTRLTQGTGGWDYLLRVLEDVNCFVRMPRLQNLLSSVLQSPNIASVTNQRGFVEQRVSKNLLNFRAIFISF